jgi:hydroxymethylglutaryl-CoA reductase (NADPH)
MMGMVPAESARLKTEERPGLQRAKKGRAMMSETAPAIQRRAIPRDRINDYTNQSAAIRREFVREQAGVELSHVAKYSFDPSILQGNIENFIGVAQVPIGVAGPLRINGEHAQGDFFVPLATTEGTLVASYNRGMRLLTECGGVKTTVVEQYMQRSPVFILEDAASAREFGRWIESPKLR